MRRPYAETLDCLDDDCPAKWRLVRFGRWPFNGYRCERLEPIPGDGRLVMSGMDYRYWLWFARWWAKGDRLRHVRFWHS